jgi:uncharacterized membrane protein
VQKKERLFGSKKFHRKFKIIYFLENWNFPIVLLLIKFLKRYIFSPEKLVIHVDQRFCIVPEGTCWVAREQTLL